VRVQPAIIPVAEELFMAIDSTFKRWLYLRPDGGTARDGDAW
jgi:hypothetical protein